MDERMERLKTLASEGNHTAAVMLTLHLDHVFGRELRQISPIIHDEFIETMCSLMDENAPEHHMEAAITELGVRRNIGNAKMTHTKNMFESRLRKIVKIWDCTKFPNAFHPPVSGWQTVTKDVDSSFALAFAVRGTLDGTKNFGNMTVDNFAKRETVVSLVEALSLLRGANLNFSDTHIRKVSVDDGNFHVACLYGTKTGVLNHFEAGTAIDGKDDFGWTPMHYAMLNHEDGMFALRTLMANGFSHEPSNGGITPLDIAKSNLRHLPDIVAMLEEIALKTKCDVNGDTKTNRKSI